ncbi:hypothetical protein [Rhodanobacter umsongensis]
MLRRSPGWLLAAPLDVPPPSRGRQAQAPWLVNALIGWLRGAFGARTHGGCWRRRESTPAVAAPELPRPPSGQSPDA